MVVVYNNDLLRMLNFYFFAKVTANIVMASLVKTII